MTTQGSSRWFAPENGDVWLMGILNCTPDSFSDGGKYSSVEQSFADARRMHQAGAAIIDVGGESTRPGAVLVSESEEMARVMPVIRELVGEGIPVSVDTSKIEVMRQALDAGVAMINDVTAFAGNQKALPMVADYDADICLMHMQGTPQTMQHRIHYDDVVEEVMAFLEQRANACIKAGVSPSSIIIDPGIGFGKSLEDNLSLIAAIPRLKRLGFPVLMGVSRKSFLGAITGADVEDRETETAAAVALCTYLGADILRIHNIPKQSRAAKLAVALRPHAPNIINPLDHPPVA